MSMPDRHRLAPTGRIEQRELERIYRDEAPRLTRYFRRHLRGSEEAHDLAQDVFRRFAQLGSANVRLLERPEAYLHQIARNLVRDRMKTARRRAYDLHIPSDDAVLESPALVSQLEARDMLSRVEVAMLQLKPRTREVFMACRVNGLSYVEISEQTGLSFKVIEKEMARALAHLHRTFGRE